LYKVSKLKKAMTLLQISLYLNYLKDLSEFKITRLNCIYIKFEEVKKKILKREKQKYKTTSYWHIWVQRNKHCLWSFN
jgi:hypothetical protein